MKTFDAAFCKELRSDLDAAMAKIAEKHGVEIKVGRMGYDAVMVKVALEVNAVDESGVNAAAARDWNMYRGLYDLADVPFGWQFTNAHGLHTICGVAARSSKFPILAKRESDGKVYKMTEKAIRIMFDRAKAVKP